MLKKLVPRLKKSHRVSVTVEPEGKYDTTGRLPASSHKIVVSCGPEGIRNPSDCIQLEVAKLHSPSRLQGRFNFV
jgi:hypothetical protein